MLKFSVLFAFSLVALTGCSTPQTSLVSSFAQRMPANAQAEETDIHTLVGNMDKDFERNHVPVEVIVRSSIALVGDAQKYSASFDLRLNHFLSQPHSNAYHVQGELDCKLWETYQVAEDSEKNLQTIQRELLSLRHQENYNWFIHLLYASKGDTAAEILTKAQLIRSLASQHADLCASGGCPSFPRVTDPRKRPFDAFNDQEMLAFKNKNLEKIATFTAAFDSNEIGSCFGAEDRQPQQETTPSFDWKGHHTAGYILQPGTFAFTYDDGPHPKYTRMLQQMWDESKLTKPTFFWLSMKIKRNMMIAESVRDDGYVIGAQPSNLPDLGNLARATSFSELNRSNRGLFGKDTGTDNWPAYQQSKLKTEIVTATNAVYETLGLSKFQPSGEHLFRLPYGSGVKNETIGRYFTQMNARHYFWTIDSLDWQDHNPASVVERVQKQMKLTKRGIILFHDSHPQSVEASRLLIGLIQKKQTVVPVTLVPLPLKW